MGTLCLQDFQGYLANSIKEGNFNFISKALQTPMIWFPLAKKILFIWDVSYQKKENRYNYRLEAYRTIL